MSAASPTPPSGEAIGRRYGAGAAREWQHVLSHFQLGEGFALLVLIVPDADGGRLCAALLETELAQSGLVLVRVEPETPEALIGLAGTASEWEPEPEWGAAWFAAPVPLAAPRITDWRSAWRSALEALNQRRNPLAAALPCPLAIVGAPWIVPLFREAAPDLWSIRRLVAHIEPDPGSERLEHPEPLRRDPRDEGRASPAPGPDPELAEQAAEALRDGPARPAERARLLARAGQGWLARNAPARAEQVLREALREASAAGNRRVAGVVHHELAVAMLDQGRVAEAEAAFREALGLKEKGGDTAVSRAITTDMLGRALRDQGRAAEAEAAFREALRLAEDGGATAVSRSIITDMLGLGLLDQGRPAEAEAAFRNSLRLAEEGGGTAVSRGFTMNRLGRALWNQGRLAEAEAAFREALRLAEEGGDTAVSRGITTHELGLTLGDQGRAAEAEAAFRHALSLKEDGDTAVSRGITMDMLGRALLDQGRAAEAEAAFREAARLAEEGGDTAVSRGTTMSLLGRALLDQGRPAEAAAALREALRLAEEGGDTAVSRGITMNLLGRALLDQGRPAEAAAALREALRLAEEGGATAEALSIVRDDLALAEALLPAAPQALPEV